MSRCSVVFASDRECVLTVECVLIMECVLTVECVLIIECVLPVECVVIMECVLTIECVRTVNCVLTIECVRTVKCVLTIKCVLKSFTESKTRRGTQSHEFALNFLFLPAAAVCGRCLLYFFFILFYFMVSFQSSRPARGRCM